MREMRPCGFVRGVPGDWYPYRGSHHFGLNSRGGFVDASTSRLRCLFDFFHFSFRKREVKAVRQVCL
jgi:hypothetical protein